MTRIKYRFNQMKLVYIVQNLGRSAIKTLQSFIFSLPQRWETKENKALLIEYYRHDQTEKNNLVDAL